VCSCQWSVGKLKQQSWRPVAFYMKWRSNDNSINLHTTISLIHCQCHQSSLVPSWKKRWTKTLGCLASLKHVYFFNYVKLLYRCDLRKNNYIDTSHEIKKNCKIHVMVFLIMALFIHESTLQMLAFVFNQHFCIYQPNYGMSWCRWPQYSLSPPKNFKSNRVGSRFATVCFTTIHFYDP
jgi:hypothetical protein